MAIKLETTGSTGVYIPGGTSSPKLGACTFDRSVIDQLNIWFSESFSNMTGLKLGCSADQLSIRNLILESFVPLPTNQNVSNGCKGIDIETTFGVIKFSGYKHLYSILTLVRVGVVKIVQLSLLTLLAS